MKTCLKTEANKIRADVREAWLGIILAIRERQKEEVEKMVSALNSKIKADLKRQLKALEREFEELKKRPPRTPEQIMAQMMAIRTILASEGGNPNDLSTYVVSSGTKQPTNEQLRRGKTRSLRTPTPAGALE